jgi:hypothetical protein
MKIDLSLSNKSLYEGCDIIEVRGWLALTTPTEKAVEIVGRNIARIIEPPSDSSAVLLTGPTEVWAYLVVFYAVAHRFSCIWYSDGKGDPVLIAAHGLIAKPE